MRCLLSVDWKMGQDMYDDCDVPICYIWDRRSILTRLNCIDLNIAHSLYQTRAMNGGTTPAARKENRPKML